jgi:phenol 2-monooxygenase
MKRPTSNSPPQSKLVKMAPGLTNDPESRALGDSLEVTAQFAYTNKDEDASSTSDVLVVGAGPAGLMLA